MRKPDTVFQVTEPVTKEQMMMVLILLVLCDQNVVLGLSTDIFQELKWMACYRWADDHAADSRGDRADLCMYGVPAAEKDHGIIPQRLWQQVEWMEEYEVDPNGIISAEDANMFIQWVWDSFVDWEPDHV